MNAHKYLILAIHGNLETIDPIIIKEHSDCEWSISLDPCFMTQVFLKK